MSALNWGQSGRRGAMPRAGLGASSWFDRFVLPKMLRKPTEPWLKTVRRREALATWPASPSSHQRTSPWAEKVE